ncbi:MAG: ATP-binding protein, partial [Candidatus Aenigmarchaeota archaeon]|nr:ATP-binding protein [Candidatus Aenigmarchaeota archaeon]
MLLKFVNRKNELKFLNRQYSSENASFVVIYGRRRVGKTLLINKFIEAKPSFYYLCKKQNLSLELERFAEKFGEAFNVHLKHPKNFEELFSDILKQIDPGKKFILTLDEFTYWIEQDKSILSTFQVIWDEMLSKKNVMLVLSGSIVSLMETEVLGYKSPLYGRRTGQWKVTPLSFFTLNEFFPKYSIEDLVMVYSCTNCIPMYLLQFDQKKSFEENINSTFFQKGNILYEEGEFLLMEELRQIETYLNIILAISHGATKLSEISSKSKVDITNILKYLKVLMRLGIIRKIKPVTLRKEKSKNAILNVSDKFFRFWTMFVCPYTTEIERGIINFANFKNEFNTYLGSVFEEVAEEYLVEQNKKGTLPFAFTKIGKEWGKSPLKKKGENAYEIDIVALNEQTKDILFCECKWQDKVDAKKILSELKEKAEFVQWNNEGRKEHYAVFAKSFKRKFREQNVMLFDMKDFERM